MRISQFAALGAAAALAGLSTAANASVIDFSTLQLNGAATATATNLRLTNGSNLADPNDNGSNIGVSSSAFISTAFSTNSTFTTSFNVTMTNTGFSPLADGITFLIQNDPAGAGAVGGGGGGVGANGLSNNVGLGLQSWDNNHVSIFTDGSIQGGPDHNFNLGDQDDLLDVTFAYDGTNLSYSVLNHTTGDSISGSQAFDLSTLGPTAYFGFTGATGLSYSIQDVTNWDLTVTANATPGVPEPATWAMMLVGFGGLGALLRRRRAGLVAA